MGRLFLPDDPGFVLASYSDWQKFVHTPIQTARERFGEREHWLQLAQSDSAAFARARIAHHSRMVVDAPQFQTFEAEIFEQLETNYATVGNRDGIVIDAPGGNLGKTTLATRIAREYERELRKQGQRRSDPAEGENPDYKPVCIATIPADPRESRFDERIISFYGHPIAPRTPLGKLPDIISDLVHSCDTSVMIIDEVQNLWRWRDQDLTLSARIKEMQNLLAVTLVLVGIDCEGNGIFREGTGIGLLADPADPKSSTTAAMTQTEGRFTHYKLQPYSLDGGNGYEWQDLLLRFEDELVLLRAHEGMLAVDLPEFLYERTSGIIGSLARLLRIAARRAIADGSETINEKTLARIRLDKAAQTLQPAARLKTATLHKSPQEDNSPASRAKKTKKARPNAIERVRTRPLTK